MVAATGMLGVSIVPMTAGFRICPPILSEERQEPQSEHVERGHAGGDHADEPQDMITAAPGRPQDSVFRKEAGEWRYAGDRKRRDRHAPESVWQILAKPAHVAHVLFAAETVNHRARPQEQQRLEEGVRHEVKDSSDVVGDTAGHEHVSELRNGGIRQHLLDIGLRNADGGGENRGQSADDGDCHHRIRRAMVDRIGAGHHVYASSHHGRGVDERRHWCGALHCVRQPHV